MHVVVNVQTVSSEHTQRSDKQQTYFKNASTKERKREREKERKREREKERKREREEKERKREREKERRVSREKATPLTELRDRFDPGTY